jgi:glyoxylate reductase
MRLLITHEIPQAAIQKAEEFFEVKLPKKILSKKELIEEVKNCDVMLCLLTDKIDEEIITANPQLKGIANYAVGFNNISVETATKNHIPVTNTPGVLTNTTADLAWALLMSVARKIVPADEYTRAGKFTGWKPLLMLGNDIFGKTIGIIGGGRIGTAVAKRAFGFDMKILYVEKNNKKELEEQYNAKKVTLNQVLEDSDFISLHVPLLPETKHLLGKDEFAKMKSSAIVINTSRGAVIDESALVEALEKKEIAGAGLDVYENEPEIHPALITMKNVVLLPHIGSASIETRTAMGFLAVENAIQMAKNQKPKNLVNPEIYV